MSVVRMGATTSCISPGLSRVVTPILAGPRVFLMGKTHRWAPPTTPSNTKICTRRFSRTRRFPVERASPGCAFDWKPARSRKTTGSAPSDRPGCGGGARAARTRSTPVPPPRVRPSTAGRTPRRPLHLRWVEGAPQYGVHRRPDFTHLVPAAGSDGNFSLEYRRSVEMGGIEPPSDGSATGLLRVQFAGDFLSPGVSREQGRRRAQSSRCSGTPDDEGSQQWLPG